MRSMRACLQLGVAVAGLLATPALADAQPREHAQPESLPTQAQSDNNVATEEGAADASKFSYMVVTARRREESPLDLPFAVSAISSARL